MDVLFVTTLNEPKLKFDDETEPEGDKSIRVDVSDKNENQFGAVGEEEMFEDQFDIEENMDESEFGIETDMFDRDEISIKEDKDRDEIDIEKEMDGDEIDIKEDMDRLDIEEEMGGDDISIVDMDDINIEEDKDSDEIGIEEDNFDNEEENEAEEYSGSDGKRSCVYRIPNVGARALPDQRVMYYG
uniref:Uncharacterized protein n=1 Tax=Cacopsylla melanoneura TaxID=428564 RepID=A0A8D9E5E1_9HEMI